MEWIDDVKQWRNGDAAAGERLREYVTPFVHGALLARLPHHVANALMPDALENVFRSAQGLSKDSSFVPHAVQVARRLAQAQKGGRQERPTTDATVAEGRQWLERLRSAAPDELREVVLWRLVEGIPGPELVEVLALNEAAIRPALERAIGETMVPAQSLAHVDYVWDVSGEPSTHLARTETYAIALRFDPLAAPESADVANTGGTFQDLNDARVSDDVRPEGNPFGDTAPTRVTTDAKAKLIPAGAFTDEKTEGAFDLPAAARELQARTDVATPIVKPPPPKPQPPARPTLKSEPKVAPVLDDERPSRRRVVEGPRGADVGRRETLEAPLETTPMTPVSQVDDERPSRSKLQVKGSKLDQALRKRADPLGPEELSGKRRAGEEERRRSELGPEEPSARRRVEAGEESARRRNPELAEESVRKRNPEALRRSEPRALEPVASASQPSIDTVPEGKPKQTERYTPEPINPLLRIAVVAIVAFSLLLAIAWRLGLF